ncbi:hypothetical protein BN1013_00558 [Candidatus Rubidus massiliensis]|nr:MAG: hypothetical protein BGO10_03590 [Chlamydia sp. 32-24]CDZ80053.1 hypothetical protein BN1013_00558 [Candidatus Rubidus massiliensis]
MNLKKNLIYFFVFLSFLFITSRIYYRATDDFRLGNIKYELPFNPKWEVDLPDRQKLKTIFSQNFFYLGKGAQSYAFVSEDQKYVVKFFKFKHLKNNIFSNLIPPVYPFKDYKEKQSLRKKRKLNSVFEGYHLAYLFHRSDSGLIYIHLNQTDYLNLNVNIKDKIGFERNIALDDVVFILQEKAKTTKNALCDNLEKGNLSEVKQKIRRIFDLYLTEYSKGLYDQDHGVLSNTGFVGEKAIHLDTGKLIKNEEVKQKTFWQNDLKKVATKFEHWIKINYPEYYPDLAEEIASNLNDLNERVL